MAEPFPIVVPTDVRRRVASLHGADGEAWIASLPQVLAAACLRWGLTPVEQLFGGHYSITLAAEGIEGEQVVVKATPPTRELRTEAFTLGAYGGRGLVRLIDADFESGVLLLERLIPGRTLLTARDDRTALRVTSAVMRELRLPAPPATPVPTVDDLVLGMVTRGRDVLERVPSFPAAQMQRALGLWQGRPNAEGRVLLHGDLHHENILATGGGWKAIDPKGVAGEPLWECTAFLRNPVGTLPFRKDLERVTARRVTHFAKLFRVPEDEVRRYGFVGAVLSAFWSAEDHGEGWEPALRVAAALEP